MRQNRTFSRGHGAKKGRRLDDFVMAMMSHRTVEAAAQATGIRRSTAYRWLQDPNVAQRIEEARRHEKEARRQARDRVNAKLEEGASEGVDCLIEIVRSENEPPVKASAAGKLLDHYWRAQEHGALQEQIDELRRLVKSPPDWRNSNVREAEARSEGNPKINGHG